MAEWRYREDGERARSLHISAPDEVLELVPPASLILIDEARGTHYSFEFYGRFEIEESDLSV